MLEKNNLKKHTTRILQFPQKFLKKKKLKNWIKKKKYLLDTEELDPLRFSLEVPFLKLVVLEPLYFDVVVLVDLALSKIRK